MDGWMDGWMDEENFLKKQKKNFYFIKIIMNCKISEHEISKNLFFLRYAGSLQTQTISSNNADTRES